MTRLEVAKLVEALRLQVLASDPHGIDVAREGCVSSGAKRWYLADAPFGVWHSERWRIASGAGIAGNMSVFWLTNKTPTPGFVNVLGPFRTQRQLRDALRKWRRWELP